MDQCRHVHPDYKARGKSVKSFPVSLYYITYLYWSSEYTARYRYIVKHMFAHFTITHLINCHGVQPKREEILNNFSVPVHASIMQGTPAKHNLHKLVRHQCHKLQNVKPREAWWHRLFVSESAVALSMLQWHGVFRFPIHWYRTEIRKYAEKTVKEGYVQLNIERSYYKLTLKASEHIRLRNNRTLKLPVFIFFFFFFFFASCNSKTKGAIGTFLGQSY